VGRRECLKYAVNFDAETHKIISSTSTQVFRLPSSNLFIPILADTVVTRTATMGIVTFYVLALKSGV